jgi:hypothetical protein
MSVGVNPPKTPVTKGSNGIAAATLPNICKMPGPPAPFVPAPLPNIGKSGDKPKGYTKKVKIEGNPVAIKGASFGSIGDMASKEPVGGWFPLIPMARASSLDRVRWTSSLKGKTSSCLVT